MKKALSYLIILVVVLLAGGLIYWYMVKTDTNDQTISGIKAPVPNVLTPTARNDTAIQNVVAAADWQQYILDNGRLIKKDTAGKKTIIDLPIDVASYETDVTPYGVLLRKRGPEKTTTVFENMGEGQSFEMPYEDGVNPEFQWYNFATQTLHRLPEVNFANTGQTFDRVYDVYASVTEPKLMIAVGEYDINSITFEPGLIGSEPDRTRGLVYNLTSGQFTDEDPLTPFLKALNFNSTSFIGFNWDSSHQTVAVAPGGEGCGRYDYLNFFDLKTSKLTTVGGAGSFDFIDGDYCNPANGVSPEGRWLILEGMTKGGTMVGVLFDITNGSTPVKSTTLNKNGRGLKYMDWDLTGKYPVYGLEGGEEYDFNQ